MIKKWLILVADVLAAALLVLVIYIVNYRLPREGTEAMASNRPDINGARAEVEADGMVGRRTNVVWAAEDWGEKFRDKFSETVISTENSYKSPGVSIEITHYTEDTGVSDMYGSVVSYTVADIYVADITSLQTAFAQNMYGVGYEEDMGEMSKRVNALCVINGDSSGNGMHADRGTVIRNGIIYRAENTNVETCVLNWDGTMDIYPAGYLAAEELIARGAYQSWIFGPSLLEEDGTAKDHFLTSSYIRQAHPRTAIGYYEPGHYCFLTVDGRQWDTARGMYLEEMGEIFQKLGCAKAYNLDGGKPSLMMMQGNLASHPYYQGEYLVQDGIFITEGM